MMVVTSKLIIGPILALIGGIIMMFASYLVFRGIVSIESNLEIEGLTWEDVGFNPILMNVRFILTLLWGILGIIGAIIAFTGKKLGSFLALIGGILGSIGYFVLLGTIKMGIGTPIPVFLSGSFFLVDTIIMVIGGLLGLILK